ncbi:MAG: hypothetical protein ABSA49_04020 [Rhizomicrobium sp.]
MSVELATGFEISTAKPSFAMAAELSDKLWTREGSMDHTKMSERDPVPYMYALRDIVFDLILEAKSLKGNDIVGQRIAMLHTLGRIKNQAVAFQLDLDYLGLADFDPERWFLKTGQISN